MGQLRKENDMFVETVDGVWVNADLITAITPVTSPYRIQQGYVRNVHMLGDEEDSYYGVDEEHAKILFQKLGIKE